MSGVLQLIGALLVWLIGLGLLLTVGFWAMANIWLLLGTFATLIGLLIVYGMATSDNEWVSIGTQWTLMGIGCFIAYLVFA